MAQASVLRALAARRERFLAFARRRIPSEADAEDLVQQAFARAADKIEGLRDPDRAEAWLYRVLRRLVAEHHARRAVEQRQERRLHDLAAAVESRATPHDGAACGCTTDVMARLPPGYVDILQRVDLDDQPVAEAASALGITAVNASVRLHRARRRLRSVVESICGPGPIAARRACADCDCDPDYPRASTATATATLTPRMPEGRSTAVQPAASHRPAARSDSLTVEPWGGS